MRYSIYNKILSGYIIFAAVSLIFINTFLSEKVTEHEISQQAQELYSQADAAATYYSSHDYNVYNADKHNYQQDIDIFFHSSDIVIWITGTQNDLLYSSSDLLNLEILPDLAGYFHDTYYTVGNFGGLTPEEYLTVYSPIVNNFQHYGYVMLNMPMHDIQNNCIRIMNIINISFIVIFIFSMIILVIFWNFVYKPLAKIIHTSKEFAKCNYKDKLKITSHDEMRTLADTINFMADGFQNLYQTQKKFIANVSHDFRSPLTSIRGYIEAILDGTIPPELQGKYLNIVLSETERLTKLTSSLLTLNSLDSDGMLLDKTNFDFIPVAKKTIASFEGQCKDKNIKIRLTHEDKDYIVFADQMRINQVIYNLIDNAIKFSKPHSDILMDISDKNDKVYVSIKDFGMGISQEAQPKIFDRFYKVDTSRGKDKQGTGLGLSIVKEIITSHNENINVVSTEGVGTEFIFSLTKGNLQ